MAESKYTDLFEKVLTDKEVKISIDYNKLPALKSSLSRLKSERNSEALSLAQYLSEAEVEEYKVSGNFSYKTEAANKDPEDYLLLVTISLEVAEPQFTIIE